MPAEPCADSEQAMAYLGPKRLRIYMPSIWNRYRLSREQINQSTSKTGLNGRNHQLGLTNLLFFRPAKRRLYFPSADDSVQILTLIIAPAAVFARWRAPGTPSVMEHLIPDGMKDNNADCLPRASVCWQL